MKKMDKANQIETMANAPVKRAILTMSIPVIMGMMVQVVYNMVDIAFISMLGDDNMTAAANLAMPILTIFMAVASIIATGAGSYISRCIGKKDNETASKTLSTGVILCIILGGILTAVGVVFAGEITAIVGAKDGIYPFAYDYTEVLFYGAIPIMLSHAGGQLLRAEGTVMPSMFGMLIGTVVNIALDPVFIFLLDMGVRGAAIATVLGNVATCIYYFTCYKNKKTILELKMKNISFSKTILYETFAIGFPASISQLLMSAATIILNNFAKNYGENAMAGMAISSRFAFIGFFIFMGFAAGCQPLMGYNYGAQNMQRVKDILKTAIRMTFTVGAVLAVVFWVFSGIITAPMANAEATAEVAARVLRISVFSYFVLGAQMLCTTAIQAFGKAKAALFLSIARQGIVYIPLIVIMNKVAGFNGLIAAQPVADAVTLVLAALFVRAALHKEPSAEASEH